MTRPPTEMELRVSAAIDSRVEDWFGDRSEANLNTLDLARAAIRAMREPTEEMKSKHVHGEHYGSHIGIVWTSMIDAASPEEK